MKKNVISSFNIFFYYVNEPTIRSKFTILLRIYVVNKNYHHNNAVQENRILMYDVYIIFLIHYNYIFYSS